MAPGGGAFICLFWFPLLHLCSTSPDQVICDKTAFYGLFLYEEKRINTFALIYMKSRRELCGYSITNTWLKVYTECQVLDSTGVFPSAGLKQILFRPEQKEFQGGKKWNKKAWLCRPSCIPLFQLIWDPDDREVPITGLFIRICTKGAAVCLTALGKVLLEIIYMLNKAGLELLCNVQQLICPVMFATSLFIWQRRSGLLLKFQTNWCQRGF